MAPKFPNILQLRKIFANLEDRNGEDLVVMNLQIFWKIAKYLQIPPVGMSPGSGLKLASMFQAVFSPGDETLLDRRGST